MIYYFVGLFLMFSYMYSETTQIGNKGHVIKNRNSFINFFCGT